MARVAVGADRGLGAARAESVQRAVGAGCVDCVGCVGCVGCGGRRAAGGAACGVSRGRGGLEPDGRGAPGRCCQNGCLGDCWTGYLSSCLEC